jgi:hypothetical protein
MPDAARVLACQRRQRTAGTAEHHKAGMSIDLIAVRTLAVSGLEIGSLQASTEGP